MDRGSGQAGYRHPVRTNTQSLWFAMRSIRLAWQYMRLLLARGRTLGWRRKSSRATRLWETLLRSASKEAFSSTVHSACRWRVLLRHFRMVTTEFSLALALVYSQVLVLCARKGRMTMQ
ncbi:hypothetical protein BT67DRAFT_445817 [Trichocladium antarcticum]|uniref:Uncharacterized protein n=1 Tax=Trichocladium antarcticum TaxID=1450529 RepID=A0AAN6UD16_9PEZI|nr:hypothetical protein BT67DRAFT_445817 [Trichocladium antarcticum]